MAGPWKAEVDFYSQELLLAKAAEVEGRWPLTHGAFHDVLPLEDPTGYFAGLAATAQDRTAERFWQGVVDWAATHGYQIRASAEIPF